MSGRLYTAARARLGMTVAEIASATSLKQSRIRNLEAGVVDPSDAVLAGYFETKGILIDLENGTISFPVVPGAGEYGRLLSVARAAAGLSQQAVAGLSGVSLRTISGMEKSTVESTSASRAAINESLSRQGIVIERDPGAQDRWRIGIALQTDDDSHHDDNEDTDMNAMNHDFETHSNDDERIELMRLRIELNELKPTVWREIVIPRNATFFDLHAAIQIAFGWNDKFSHEFRCGVTIGVAGVKETEIDFVGELDERMVRLDHVYAMTESFVYRYGKGEHWMAEITVRNRLPGAGSPLHPVLVDGKGGRVPEDAWAEQWTETSAKLREGKADEGDLDWLHLIGFGRDYNPDLFDMDAANEDLAGAGFDIAATRSADYARRLAIAEAADSVLPAARSHPRRPKKPTAPKGGFVISKVEKNGQTDVVYDEDHGLLTCYPKKAGGYARLRSTHGVLADILEYAPDVESFETFPVSVHWTSGRSKGLFQPDLRITDTDGRKYLLHVAHTKEEHEFALSIAAMLPENMKVITKRFLDDGIAECCEVIAREVHWVEEVETSGVDKALLVDGLANPIPVSRAVRTLAINGFGRELDGFTGGNPETRAKKRLLRSVVAGTVGMDFGRPFERTVVGKPSLTSGTFSFAKIMQKYS